jgi:acetyl-CoA acyltransferase
VGPQPRRTRRVRRRSQEYARRATDEGRFDREIIPVLGSDRHGMVTHRRMACREGTTRESLAKLKPVFRSEEDGRVTAGNSSQITDGASAMLIMSEAEGQASSASPPRPLPSTSRWPAPTRG